MGDQDSVTAQHGAAADLADLVGNMDIYLLDQVLKGRIPAGCRILDAGCGGGRNVVYFLRRGDSVSGVDESPQAIESVRHLALRFGVKDPSHRFRQESLESMSFEDASFDFVILNAVLHFATNPSHFEAMLKGAWRVVAGGGILFVRLASSIGIENRVRPLGEGRYHLPDGSTRYLVDESDLLQKSKELGGTVIEPIKTVNVQNLRCMTTWCLQK